MQEGPQDMTFGIWAVSCRPVLLSALEIKSLMGERSQRPKNCVPIWQQIEDPARPRSGPEK